MLMKHRGAASHKIAPLQERSSGGKQIGSGKESMRGGWPVETPAMATSHGINGRRPLLLSCTQE